MSQDLYSKLFVKPPTIEGVVEGYRQSGCQHLQQVGFTGVFWIILGRK